MSARRLQKRLANGSVGKPDTGGRDMVAAGYSQNVSLMRFLISEYGNFEFVIDVADSFIDLGKRFFKKKPKYQAALTFLKYGIPAAVFTADVVAKLNKYRQIRSGKNAIYNEREEKVKQLLEIKSKEISLSQDDFLLGKDVFYWLFKMPKTVGFKILGYYNYESMQPVQDVWNVEQGTMIIVIEYDGARFAWITNLVLTMLDDVMVRESMLYFESKYFDKKLKIKAAIYKEFLNHFDIKNNIICLHPSGLHAFPRQDAKEEIKQFSMDKFSAEIRKVLVRKKKRGFAFVGIPGTGKSTIIRKLENSITDYPIIYTTAANYSTQFEIQETFTTIQFIQPCIVIMEDLDSYDLRDKKSNLGVFLDQIDDVNARLNAVFIATINDTSLVHYTLINRPGRFDQVILVRPPQDPEEVYGVMKTRYNKNKKQDSTITGEMLPYGEIDKEILKEIINNKFTQADICEIIEKALLISDRIDNDTLKSSLEELKKSKEAIKQCNFGGEDPRNANDAPATPTQSYGGPFSDNKNITDVKRYANRS